ncbi:GNAT family N-acetyltransferase [Arthrobacter sp. MDT2-2]
MCSLTYILRAGQLVLRGTIVATEHRDEGLEAELIRDSLLSAHRRRLSVTPYCPHVQAFLAVNPHFQALVSST